MAYITQNTGYGVDIPGSQDIVSGLYPSYAGVTQTGGGKGGHIYLSPVSGKTRFFPSLIPRIRKKRQNEFDAEERARLDEEDRARLDEEKRARRQEKIERKERKRRQRERKKAKTARKKARDFMKSFLSQSKQPEDNVEGKVNGGSKKRKQIRTKKRGSSKRKNRRVSTLRKKRGSSKRKKRGSFKIRKHSKREVVQSIMKGLGEKRKSRKKNYN